MENMGKEVQIIATEKAILHAISGGLKCCIDAHGEIDKELIGSAVKRIFGQLKKHIEDM